MAKLVILIAGNICAGKSTLINYLQENKDLFSNVLDNDEELRTINEFIDPESLKLFYKDRRKYSSIFEFSCLSGRIVRHSVAEHHNGIVLFDRGIIEGCETFAKNSYLEGYLSYNDYQEYLLKMRTAFDNLSRVEEDQKKWLEQLVIYLKVDDTNILVERNKKRATKGEIIPKEYFDKLENTYDKFFKNIDNIYSEFGLKAPAVLTIDASIDISKDNDYLKKCADIIISKTNELLHAKQMKL